MSQEELHDILILSSSMSGIGYTLINTSEKFRKYCDFEKFQLQLEMSIDMLTIILKLTKEKRKEYKK